jgi:prophage regulatory protein
MTARRLITLAKVVELTSLSKSTLYALAARGEFPSPRKAGGASRWIESEVDAWIVGLECTYTDSDPASYKGVAKKR